MALRQLLKLIDVATNIALAQPGTDGLTTAATDLIFFDAAFIEVIGAAYLNAIRMAASALPPALDNLIHLWLSIGDNRKDSTEVCVVAVCARA